ncbi:MAG: DNA methyltransferase [Candidatus Thiodiazotropha endolucinida]|uniref:Putative methyltransferase n=1 Tax=Candidatus Thiodiazotropha endolucinida TaxID=1655433 RepID=A0A7Z1AG68_9GAMM|nr:DNA methyltransferase [Candidatus Thiodiazotropha endolucinida]ODJ87774.1 putative methyltransferase [Candidatus Thiodiazotropha endolucinida]
MDDLFNSQADDAGPVECLGQPFQNDKARREHFLKLLAEKLKDPGFRNQEGFPHGTDEAILEMSDPPYYTACPNPWLTDFLSEWKVANSDGTPKAYEPFVSDVSEGKNDPIYNAHSYHTKVPHKAIMRYIEHYTKPGDVVFDGFCGTGMTGVAAQLTGRQAILCDLAPLATFLASNFCTTTSPETFSVEVDKLHSQIESDVDALYRTNDGQRDFTIYSTVVECENCQNQFDQWTESYDEKTKGVAANIRCPACNSQIASKTMKHARTTVYDPILDKFIETKKRVQRFVKIRPNTGPAIEVWSSEDGNSYEKFSQEILRLGVPILEIPRMYESHYKRNLAAEGVTHFHHFYTPRNLLACLRLWNLIRTRYPLFKFAFLNTSWHATIMRRYNAGGGHRPKTNTLYIPALASEGRVSKIYEKKLQDIIRFLAAKGSPTNKPVITTASSSSLKNIPSDSIDYIFIDPPFGSNIMYSDLNFIWEAWLGVRTDIKQEAVENQIQEKTLDDYRVLMRLCFSEFWRILKPGRWMTVEFSNTNASIWNSIQSALSEAGFIVANVSTLDKKQRSINSYTSTTSVKQDLVISAYKPNGGLEERFEKFGSSEESAWDFVKTHLKYLPTVKSQAEGLEFIAERDPRIIFDRMVAWFVRHNTPIPLSSQEFQDGLRQRFPERDGMVFLPDQVSEYEKKRAQVAHAPQMELFVSDERSAIDWLTEFLKRRPSTYQEIHPEFIRQMGAGWRKHEAKPELADLLEENFLKYEGSGDVPSQIHSYLSTNHKDLRGLDKSDKRLVAKAKDRWFVPDPNKAQDLEKKREKALLKEFETYLAFTGRRLKEFRLEVLRAGFKAAWVNKDYQTIIKLAQKIPEASLQEDEQLLMWYDHALTRTEADA